MFNKISFSVIIRKSSSRRKIIAIIIAIFMVCSARGQNNTFQLGYSGAYPSYYYLPTYNINWGFYHELNLNLWQGWWAGDTAVNLLNELNTNNINAYFQPDTLRWAAYGRQQVNYAAGGRDSRFIYNYVSPCGMLYPDITWNNGLPVLSFDKNYVCVQQQMPGLALSQVKQNAFQSLTGLVGDPMFTVEFPGGGGQQNNTYYVKPRMRISVADAFSTPPKNVCKVIIKAFDGSTLNEVTITTANFRDATGSNYNGQYLEDYYQCPIYVDGMAINQGRPLWNYDPLELLDQCHVDYQIYWYGTVSFYIDYVKVMDEPAQELFGTRPLDILIKNRLRDKIARLKANDIGNKIKGFYQEEIDFSNISCVKLLNDSLLPAWSNNDPDYKIIPLVNPASFNTHLRDRDWTYFYNYFDSITVPVFMTSNNLYTSFIDSTGQGLSKLPNNLSSTLSFPSYYSNDLKNEIQTVYNVGTSFVSLDNYNTYVQSRLDIMEGYLKGLFTPLCAQHNIKLVPVPSVTYWHYHTSNFLNREPMTSEIEVQFGIEICNGAKGILPFAYESWYSDYFNKKLTRAGSHKNYKKTVQTTFHYDMSLGASDFDAGNTWGLRKRELDVYGENKWDSLKYFNSKITAWGPILANSNYTTGYSVSTDGANHNYINDIHSIDPSQGGYNPACYTSGTVWLDCPDQRYWELGFFNPPYPPQNPADYFMLVNRRCAPAINGYHGDNRVMQIKFNTPQLPGYASWKITDVYTGQYITFDTNSNYVDLGNTDGSMGWFHPGESKLFKVEPVNQIGIDPNGTNLPTTFSLSQNYPNPFNPTTTIKFAIPLLKEVLKGTDATITIKIYDISGREVKTLVNEFPNAGYYEEKFDGSNYASGVYFYRIEVRASSILKFVDSKKMVLLK